MNNKITSSYIRDLAVIYHAIDNRGILFDEDIMQRLDTEIQHQVNILLNELSQSWGIYVFVGAENKPKDFPLALNLNSPAKLLEQLKKLGYDVPKVRRKNKETYEVEYEESVEELVLRKIFAENSSLDIKQILEIRELNTLRSRYVNSKRLNGTFYSCYNTAGTITGRRSCKKHTFGLGGNATTFPKHYSQQSACYTFGQTFLQGLVARPNKLLFFVDQMSAEDWPTNALAENKKALEELRNQVDRHTNLASYIFGIPVQSRTKAEWKDSIERYLGKKSRHAFNYGMRGATMSDSLAKEGFSLDAKKCQEILNKVDSYDPSVERVFHKYIKDTIYQTNMLRTPFGRERHFHGLRQNDANYKIFNEAYSYIPQSTVADNTGFAVYHIEQTCADIINECQDSIAQEIYNDLRTVLRTYDRTRRGFDRAITFHNGISIRIPIEGEIGFNFLHTVRIKDFSEEGVKLAFQELNDIYHPFMLKDTACAST